MDYENATSLDSSEFRHQFRQAWGLASSRFFKVERRQTYNQTGDASYDAFVRGEFDDARRQLSEGLETQREMYSDALAKGVKLLRLRQIELPLSQYLIEYEGPSYRTSASLGEDIFVLDITNDLTPPEHCSANELPDCIIFDESVVFVNLYDGSDRPAGALRLDSNEDISAFLELAEASLGRSQAIDTFVSANRDLVPAW